MALRAPLSLDHMTCFWYKRHQVCLMSKVGKPNNLEIFVSNQKKSHKHESDASLQNKKRSFNNINAVVTFKQRSRH